LPGPPGRVEPTKTSSWKRENAGPNSIALEFSAATLTTLAKGDDRSRRFAIQMSKVPTPPGRSLMKITVSPSEVCWAAS
jgi:hypothetical protein